MAPRIYRVWRPNGNVSGDSGRDISTASDGWEFIGYEILDLDTVSKPVFLDDLKYNPRVRELIDMGMVHEQQIRAAEDAGVAKYGELRRGNRFAWPKGYNTQRDPRVPVGQPSAYSILRTKAKPGDV